MQNFQVIHPTGRKSILDRETLIEYRNKARARYEAAEAEYEFRASFDTTSPGTLASAARQCAVARGKFFAFQKATPWGTQ